MTRQRLGQHFLCDDRILSRIAQAACPEREPVVVEIGAGQGPLTAHLLERAGKVVAIELDRALADSLAVRFAQVSNFQLVRGDVLETDLSAWGPCVITGNLPYYITSPILAKTLRLGPLLRRGVFLVQKDLAVRAASAPGRREYGYLSVFCQAQASVDILFSIPPGAFRPPPQVWSALLRLVPRRLNEEIDGQSLIAFLEFAKTCFRMKRKTLRNNLEGHVPAELLEGCPEISLRAEQLSVEELWRLYRRLTKRA